RLRGGARCAAWQGRRRAFGLDRRASQGGLVGRAQALEQARPLGQTLRLFLGRRHSCSGPAGRRCAVPAGHYWRHTGGQEGVGRPHRRRAREHTILEGAAPRPQASWAIDGPRARGCRWRARLLASPRRGMATHARPALLGAQDRQRAQQALPKSQQSKAKRALQEIWMAETKKDALLAFDAFIETWGVKYDRATECLIKDRDALLAFYDFPAEHWKHLRTTNVIESSFATVRHRTVRSKGCLSNKTALAMI